MKQARYWALALLSAATCALGRPLPFADYPVEGQHNGANAAVRLTGLDDRAYRTRLRLTAQQPANFAGHYSLGLWGCGAGCLMGAAVDLNSGRVIWLPGTVSGADIGDRDEQDYGYSDPDSFELVDFRKDSRLLVFNGMLDEQGDPAQYLYQLKMGRFILVERINIPHRDHEDPGKDKPD